MDTFFVTLSYDPKRVSLNGLNNGKIDGNEEGPQVSTSPLPTKFIKLNYNRKVNSMNGIDANEAKEEGETEVNSLNSSPIRNRRKKSSKASTPSSEIESSVEPESFQNVSNIRQIPFKDYKSALANLYNYQIQYYESNGTSNGTSNGASNGVSKGTTAKLPYDQSMDQEWLQDIQVICDRLHLLREVHKCIQLVKKKNNHSTLTKVEENWFDIKSQSFNNLDSDEDMKIIKDYNQNINSSEQDDDEGSSSNTDTSIPKKRRRVQFAS